MAEIRVKDRDLVNFMRAMVFLFLIVCLIGGKLTEYAAIGGFMMLVMITIQDCTFQ